VTALRKHRKEQNERRLLCGEASSDSIDDEETIARLMREGDEDTILAEIWMAAYEKARDEVDGKACGKRQGHEPPKGCCHSCCQSSP
jgi:hypothetical protein